MTGNTNPREKVRAVFLAAIMVLSVFAMSAAFAGSAAAITDDATATDVNLAGNSPYTQTIEFTLEDGVDYESGGDGNEYATINVSDASLDLSAVTLANVTDSNGDDIASGVTASADAPNDLITVTVDETDTNTDVSQINVELEAEYNDGEPKTDSTLTIKTAGDADVSASDTTTTEPFDVQGLAIVSVTPSDATSVIEEGTDELYDVTVENTGDTEITQDVTVEVTGTAGSDTQSVTVAAGETATVTGLNPGTSGLATGTTETVTVSTEDDSLTGEVSVRDSDNVFISGEITDKQLRNIDSDIAERLEVTVTETGNSGNEIISSVPLSDFDTLASNNGYVDEANFIPGEPDQYTLEVATFGDTGNVYEFVVEDPEGEFGAFAGSTEELDSGTNDGQDFRLERFVQADNLEVTDPADGSQFDLGESFDATVLAESYDADSPFDELSALEGEEVTASNVTAEWNNPNDAGASLVIDQATNTTVADGTTDFNIGLSLDGPAEAYDQDIEAQILFEAGSSGETATLNVTFIGEPPSGHGTIAGDVDEISEDIQVGAQSENAGPAEDINVYAVQQSRADANTLAIDDGDATDGVGALDDGTEFFRVVNATSEEPVDVRMDYLVKTGSMGNGTVEIAHNASIPGTGFDITSDGTGYFEVIGLEEGDYQLQTSENGSFEAPTDVGSSFTASNDLTYDAIDERYSPDDDIPAEPTDVTGEDGEFFLTNLYTNGTTGVDYLVIAGQGNPDYGFANGLAYDAVTVHQSSDYDDPQQEVNLAVQGIDVTIYADNVNVTQVGTHPALDETDGSPDVEQIDPFEDQSDDTYQRVARDGTVDVIKVETSSSEYPETDVSGEVTVELNDDFDGQFLDTVLDGEMNADDSLLVSNDETNTTITVDTDENGTAYVLLQTEDNSSTLDTNKSASISNELYDDSDESNVTFVGTTTFESAGVSGIARDSDDTLIPNAVVWAEEFEWDDAQKITIEPDTDATPGTPAYADALDDESSPFIVTLKENNGSAWVEVENETATRSELESYEFTAFDSIDSEAEFRLTDVVEDPETASYTLEPIPAVTGDVETDYTLRGVKLDAPEEGVRSLTGTFAVDVGEGETQNVIFPIDVERAELEVSGVADQTINEGDNVTVDAVIENTGGNQSATQTVEFIVDGETLDSQTITVTAGAQQSVTFEGDTSELAADEYDMTVQTNDDSQTATLTVEQEPANFELSNLEEPTVEQGETFELSVDVKNTGGQTAEQEILLGIGGTFVDSEFVELNPEQSDTVTFTVPADYEPGTYGIHVVSEDDDVSGTLTVEEAQTDDWWEPYTDDDDIVQDDGINAAVQDYLNDDLSEDRFNILVQSYLSEEPVPNLI